MQKWFIIITYLLLGISHHKVYDADKLTKMCNSEKTKKIVGKY